VNRFLIGAAVTAIIVPQPVLAAEPSAARLSEVTKTLGSDAFEGRGPATRAEEKTVAYIIDQFKAAGVEPGGDIVDGKRGWTQNVPLLKTDIVGAPDLKLSMSGGAPMTLTQGEEITVKAPLDGSKSVNLANVPLVFVGYGVTAPERQWDDFKGVDVKGKLLVEFINDPDFDGGEGDFGGKAMTYYGRWTYKYEEAARRGAAGTLIIHETEPASYGWATVKNSNSNTQFDIVLDDPASAHAPVEAWIQKDLAEKLFAASGMTLADAHAMAKKRDFKPVELGATMDVKFATNPEVINSKNVVGLLPGTKYPDETVIYTAHWDHLGIGKPDAKGDTIYNGALDNATGTAQLIEEARLFAAEPRIDRSIVFLAVTAEEKGLLGSRYYALHPLYAPGKTVGVLNTDGGQLWGRAKNFTISGNAKLGLLDMLIAEGKKRGRYFSPDPHPEAGYFFRSDHFSMAKAGIPAISFNDGNDLVNGGTERGEALGKIYVEQHYHQPSDEWSPDWDFTGMAEDVALLHALGRDLANSRLWPEWSDDSEFKAVRDQTAGERAGGTTDGAPADSSPPKKGERR